jgi:hypothetical protein
MHRTHLRALLAAFVAFVTVAGGVLVATAHAGDAQSDAVATEGQPTPTTAATSTPPLGAEDVLAEAQRQTQAYADAVHAFEAEQAVQAEQAAQLEALAAAQAAQAEEAVRAQAAARTGIQDSYWDRMAYCETGGNWSMVGSKYSGGLGFWNGTWDGFGGREFAARAGQATREQQIIVANRVADSVGLSGWGCLAKVGRP